MIDASNLRTQIPEYDTPQLEIEWRQALEELTRLDELDISCAMGMPTRRILFQTVRAMGATDVLDIGTFTGASALVFALAVGKLGRVTTVDIQDVNATEGHWKNAGRTRTPKELMEQAGVADRVEFVTQDSGEYLQSTSRMFDFISIDGWHESWAVYSDIRFSLPRLKPEGLIFLDDIQRRGYCPPPGFDVIKGPWKAIRWYMREGAPFNVTQLSQIPDHQPLACAFLTRKP